MITYSAVVNPRPLKPVSRETWEAAEQAHGRPPRPRVTGFRTRRKPRHVAHGHETSDRPSIQHIRAGIDAETFAELRAIAVKQRRSFAAVLRDMVEWGLQDFQREGTRI